VEERGREWNREEERGRERKRERGRKGKEGRGGGRERKKNPAFSISKDINLIIYFQFC
jgi:hypothetical protein